MRERTATAATVQLWGTEVGAVVWNKTEHLGHFTYNPDFIREEVEVAPITVPLKHGRFAFPDLNTNVFKGLPGFLADSLPDKFGTLVIDTWLAQHHRPPHSFNPVERLCLIGSRGMGALEYSPNLLDTPPDLTQPLDLPALVNAVNLMLSEATLQAPTTDPRLQQAIDTLLYIGTPADGARAKAVIGWTPDSTQVYAGHGSVPESCGYWLMKFDGITGNRDREDACDPQGWGVIEYAYYLMARAAGIDMMECRLLNENGRRHFMTRRFDRTDVGEKLHRQSLCAMGHMDFDALGAYSYEQVMDIMRDLGLPQSQVEELFRRMVFNVLARNHDDHAKNIAFLMDQAGTWSLAPAYDLTFAYNPRGHWTNRHQMTINGKRDHFSRADLMTVAEGFAIPPGLAGDIIQEVADAVAQWLDFADHAGVKGAQAEAIAADLRLHIL